MSLAPGLSGDVWWFSPRRARVHGLVVWGDSVGRMCSSHCTRLIGHLLWCQGGSVASLYFCVSRPSETARMSTCEKGTKAQPTNVHRGAAQGDECESLDRSVAPCSSCRLRRTTSPSNSFTRHHCLSTTFHHTQRSSL